MPTYPGARYGPYGKLYGSLNCMARPRTFDEDQVVCAARDQFWATGYTATSLDDLTAATGLGRGSLYGAFGD
ncbi:transcriptional regulator, TetR family [Frankia torreyi]|uniref:Transcriptional regulator, TetR family n=1 Tax=Frankia torreyi TaxID=1856 RepID=A0A0D8BIJ7_9ACTN|nr:transcriptional regulator, TetR family [Frankia torreyi]KQM05728.1 transcriptional regulator, TetR family [Frankia sp. CpI1-P]